MKDRAIGIFDSGIGGLTVYKAIKKLMPAEKVIYLGKGSFAVVELQAYQKRSLKITRRMDWENLEEKSEWRRELRTDLK